MTAPGKKEKEHGKHPTQKPTELLKRLIMAGSNEGDIVLDAFNGSGTTGVAYLTDNDLAQSTGFQRIGHAM